jgi:hypothetical protein
VPLGVWGKAAYCRMRSTSGKDSRCAFTARDEQGADPTSASCFDLMQQTLEQYLARAILQGTRKSFSRLHGDYLEQEQHRMSETTNNMTVPSVVPVSVKPVDRKTLEGSTPGDFRGPQVNVVMPPQLAPRDAGATNDLPEGAGA